MKNEAHEKFITDIYMEYYSQIAALCTALLDGDDAEAALCAQEVFDQAIMDVETLIKHPNIVGWLRKTASNRVKRALRAKGRRAKYEVHITDLSERYIESLRYIQEYDEQYEKHIDIDKEKQTVLQQLLPDEAVLYDLRFVKRLTFKQISEQIGMSESASRMRVVRLELRIKQIVAELFK